MKINNYEGALVDPQIVAEFEALHMDIADLKKQIKDLVEIVNANKGVLFDTIELMKSSNLSYKV